MVGFMEFMRKYASTGDRLGEYFYAVWMLVVSIGIINSTGDPNEEGMVAYTVMIAVGVNFTWGVIDGLTVMYTKAIDRATNDKIVYDLRTKKGDPAVRKNALNILGTTMVSSLTDEEQAKFLDTLAAGEARENPYQKRYHTTKDEKYFALTIIGIELMMVIPLLAPFLIFGDAADAAQASRWVAAVIFVILGVLYARELNRRKWLAGLFLGTVLFVIAGLAYAAGW